MYSSLLEKLFPRQWPLDSLPDILANIGYQKSLSYLFISAGFLGLALLLGMGMCSLLLREEKTRRPTLLLSAYIFIGIGLGIALIIAELFLLSMLHVFTPLWIVATLGVSSLVAVALIVRNHKALRSVLLPAPKYEAIVTLLVLMLLAVYQLASVSHWMISDATSYHLPYADFFLLNKGWAAVPEHLIYPYHSLNFNLLYSLAMLVNRELFFLQFVHALFATLTVFGIYVFCRSAGQSLSIAITAMAVFIMTASIVNYYRMAAIVDCGSMYFIFCTAFTLVLWIQTRNQWLLMISAIHLGIAIGIKYLMCIFALPIAIAIMAADRNIISRNLFIYAACAGAWGLWWYARNALLTGNPVHPFASNIFGQFLWNDQDVQLQMNALLDTRIPRTLNGFLLMPYHAIQNITLRDQGAHATLCMLYVSTLFSWWHNRAINTLLIFSWIYVIAWFFGAQDPRYLMPVMPLVVVHAGSSMDKILRFLLRPSFLYKTLSAALCVAALASLALNVKLMLNRSLHSEARLPLEIIEENMRQNPVYDLMSHANELFDRNETVYEFFMREGRWFYQGNLVGNQFGPHSYFRVLDESVNTNGQSGQSPERLERLLIEKYHADGFLMPTPPYVIYNQQQFDEHFTVLYRNSIGTIYRLKK